MNTFSETNRVSVTGAPPGVQANKQGKSLSEVNASVDTSSRGWRKLFAFMGPAYLVSVGYMDPGNWATDIAGGSKFGYTLIWVLLMSNLMALLLQSLSARLGVVRQLDLAQASRASYPPVVIWLKYLEWLSDCNCYSVYLWCGA